MINHLGWKTDFSEDNSDYSIDSLTDADQAELDDFFSFLSKEDVTTDDSLSNAESDCFRNAESDCFRNAESDCFSDDCSSDCCSNDCSDDNLTVAPPFSPIPSTENGPDLDAENPKSNQQEPTTEILGPCGDDGTSEDDRVWNGFKLVGDNIDKNYRQSFN